MDKTSNLECSLLSNKSEKNNTVCKILTNSLAATICMVSFNFVEFINITFIKYTEKEEFNLAVFGLGTMYYNIVYIIFGLGILGSLDTMGSYCFGKKLYLKLGLYTIRTRIFIFILGLFSFILSLLSYRIFRLLNIDEELASSTYYFILLMQPKILLLLNHQLNVRYLQVMQIYNMPSILTISSLFIHFIFSYLFVILLNMGFYAVCLASFVTMAYNVITSSLYITIANPNPESLMIYHEEVFTSNEFNSYLILSIYSGFQLYGDYIGYEVIYYFTIYLDYSGMATAVIILNFLNLIDCIYVGSSYTISQYVSYYLGKGDYSKYRAIIKKFFFIYLSICVVISGSTYAFRFEIIDLYTKSEKVAEILSRVLIFLAIFINFDVFNYMLQGILKGCGMQNILSFWNNLLTVVWMIPVSHIACFYFNMGVYGIFTGCFTYMLILACINMVYFVLLDEKEINKEIFAMIDDI